MAEARKYKTGEFRKTGMKFCTKCNAEKPLSQFYSRANRRPNRTTERVYNAECKACTRTRVNQRGDRFADLADEIEVPPEKRCSKCRSVKPAAQFSINRRKRTGLSDHCYACIRDRRYGLASGQYDELFAQQGGTCAICHRCPRQVALSVDHDHVTGRVRGLLCQNCNAALGMFKDDPALLARAIDYLKEVV